jgi:Caspase domain
VSTTAEQRVDRALLIGIDRYDNIIPDLAGAVSDVERIAKFLTERLKTPTARIRTLVSRLDGSEEAGERATRDNIIAAFKALAEQATPDEQVYIHYSGHGIRNDTTILPGIEPDGRDEGIAPADSGYRNPAKFYLLDKELGWLIRRITDKKAFVTVILDCCHSASGTRDVAIPGGDGMPTVRQSLEGNDPRPRTDANLVAPIAELKAVVVAPDGSTGSLVPPLTNYILLTACRENETAKEYMGKQNGVFTYFLLEHADKEGIEKLTYRDVQDRIGGSVLKLASLDPLRYDKQTPQLEGDGNLILFGGGVAAGPFAVSASPLADGTVIVPGAGEAVGVVLGTAFALYPPGTIDFGDPKQQLAIVTVEQARPDAAVCRVQGTPSAALVPGMRAIITRPGVAKIRRKVALVGDGLVDLRAALDAGGNGSPLLELVDANARPELTVIVDGGNYVIRDNLDKPLPRIKPVLAATAGDRAAADQVRQRLEHVVHYLNAWDLNNGDEESALRDKLAISVVRAQTRSAGQVDLTPGETITLCVHNRSGAEVSAALLYFSPDWSVQRLWPEDASFTLLGSTNDDGLKVRTMEVRLPNDENMAIEKLKLFATHKDRPSSFDLLQLGSLNITRDATRGQLRGPTNELEALLESMGTGSATRELVSVTRTGDWGTAELVLLTHRGT